MNDVYTGIDLGTDSVKIVVCSKIGDHYSILASSSYPSSGIKDGFIVDTKAAVNSVKKAVSEVEDALGIPVSKVVACVPPTNCSMDIVSGSATVEDYNEIRGEDVSKVLLDALKQVELGDVELVTAMPIHFTIDDDVTVSDPKGMRGSTLSAKVVVSTTEKEPLYKILEVLSLAGLDTVDISYSSFGDYYACADKKYDELVGAIINIGETSTNISIFNRGIQIKNGLIPAGSLHVDKDLAYAFKCNLEDARRMKENFALALASYADSNDTWTVVDEAHEEKEINQLNASKVVEARVREILKLAKNEIKNLTNREIRYIIITGGLSELAGFPYLVDQEFGFVAKLSNITTMGVRHNKFSSCLGIVRFFHDKLDLRGKSYNMFTNEELGLLMSCDSVCSISNDNTNHKVFDHFFDV